MSKQNNANSDHYKVAGREHPGDDVHHPEERQPVSGAKAQADVQNISGTEEVEPTLSDDEGYTG